MIGTWIVAVEMLQRMRPQGLIQRVVEKRDRSNVGAYSKDGVVYEDKNEREWIAEHCERVYSDWQLQYSG